VTAEEIMPEDGAVTPNGSVVCGDPPSGEAGTGHGVEVKTVGAGALEPPSFLSLCPFGLIQGRALKKYPVGIFSKEPGCRAGTKRSRFGPPCKLALR
jgi:hypothetical protein